MCRAEVSDEAAAALAALMVELVEAVCTQTGDDPALVRIGPIDFGGAEE